MTLPCHLCHVSSKHLVVIFPRNEPQDGVTLGHLFIQCQTMTDNGSYGFPPSRPRPRSREGWESRGRG